MKELSIAEQMVKLSNETQTQFIKKCLDSIYEEVKKIALEKGTTCYKVYFPQKTEYNSGITEEDLENFKETLESDGFKVWTGSYRSNGAEFGLVVRW